MCLSLASPPNRILARLDVRTTLSKKFNGRNGSPCSSQTGGRGGRKLGRSSSCSAHLKEIFFGGTRGGGKTDGVLGKWALKEKRYGSAFNAIMFRKTTVSAEDAIER